MNIDSNKIDFSKIKLVISDLDGTLLLDNKEISERTVKAINLIKEKGIYFTISTGREYAMLEHFLRIIKPNCPVISNNGSEICCYPSDEVIFRRFMPDKQSKQFLKYCFNNHIDFCMTTIDAAYFPIDSQMTNFYRDYEIQAQKENLKGFPVILVNSFEDIKDKNVNKIILRTDLVNYQQAINYANTFEDCFDYTMSSNTILEIMPYGAGKQFGLKKLTEYLNIKKEEILSFGDYDNDILMFEESGISVAMFNAKSEVKKHATIITDSNENDGVAIILEKIVKERNI